jgi:hypothetical protein
MDYDRGRGRMVLVTDQGLETQTWEYGGSNWSRVLTASTPLAQGRGRDHLVYDAGRGVMVFVSIGWNETWEFNGFQWTRRNIPPAPAVTRARMVFDPLRSRVLLHGGYDARGTTSGNTWEYDGVAWQLASQNNANPAREDFAFAFDAHRRRAVLFGGWGPMVGGTYEYDGVWRQSTMVGPPDRLNAAMTYDPLRQECVLFGGAAQNYTQGTRRHLSLPRDQPRHRRRLRSGLRRLRDRAGVHPRALPRALPRHAVRCNLYALPGKQPSFVALGASRTSFFGALLPLSLDVLGMTGCLLHVSLDVLLPAAGSGRSASLALTIPTQNSLVGRPFYLQAFALDVGGNAANLINSRALECRIGRP